MPNSGASLGTNEYVPIKEGLAEILVHKGTPTLSDPQESKTENSPAQSVFYNPIQQFNRDLSVLAIKAFGEDFIARSIEKRERNRKGILARKEINPTGEGSLKRQKISSHSMDGRDVYDNTSQKEFERNIISSNEDCATKSGSDDVQQQNGDSQILSHSIKAPRFLILDALSATGLRALRYAHELPFVTSVTANDLSPKATESIILNVEHNKLGDKIVVNTRNACAHMHTVAYSSDGPAARYQKYHVIDLDPYGTAVPFLDAALQALINGGMLCVTCTDSGVFASAGYLEKTFSLYGGLPIKGMHSHEGGLRLVLHAICTSAARYGLSVEPLLSLSIDFYVRLFVRVHRSPADVKFLAGKTMLVHSCDSGCGAWQTQFLARHTPFAGKNGLTLYKHTYSQEPGSAQNCQYCGFKTHVGYASSPPSFACFLGY